MTKPMTPEAPEARARSLEKLRRIEETHSKLALNHTRLMAELHVRESDRAEKLRQIEHDARADMRGVLDRPTAEPDLPTARVVRHGGLWAWWKARLFATWVTALVWGWFAGGVFGGYTACRVATSAAHKAAQGVVLQAKLREIEAMWLVTQCFDAWYASLDASARPMHSSAEESAKATADCDRAIRDVVEDKLP